MVVYMLTLKFVPGVVLAVLACVVAGKVLCSTMCQYPHTDGCDALSGV